ncbi:MAG: putative LPS assembly protein LptD [Candidatus Eisenbacteria bacterium]
MTGRRSPRFTPLPFLFVLISLSPVLSADPPGKKADVPVYITGDRLRGSGLRGEEPVLDLAGNVRFLAPDRRIAALGRRGIWRESTGRLQLSGDARVYRDESWAYGRVAVIDEERSTLEYPKGVMVVEAGRTIVADRAIFYLSEEDEETERVLFTGSVAVLDSARQVLADTLEVDPGAEGGTALGGVSLELYRESYRVRGRRADFDNVRIVVTGDPVMEELDSLGEVSGTLTGDTITIEPEAGRVIARGSTHGDYRKVETFAGVTVMESDSNFVFLTGDPRLVREGESLWGDSIDVRFSAEEEEIERVVVRGGATMESEGADSLTSEEGRTAGDRMTLFFDAGDLRKVAVTGRAKSDRSVRDGMKARRERNHAEGDTIRFHLGEEELETIEVSGKATGDQLSVEMDADSATEKSETVRYRGDRVRFDVRRNRVYLQGNAHVDQGQMQLDAERIRFDIDRDLVTAQGNPILKDGDQEVDGRRMVYNVDVGQGTIYDGVTHYEAGICYGDRIHRASNKTLLLEGGKYTSCDDPDPHYYFLANRMKIYLDDKIVVRPIVMHIADIPVLALPYYLFPLKGGRSSGFILPTIEFGFSESKGRFVRNGGYFWAINDYADLTFRGDFFEDSHWVSYLDGRYRLRYLLNGTVRSSYQSSQGGRRRWSVQAGHNQEIGESTDLTMRANFVSDKTYRVEQSTTLEELDRTLKSDLVLKKRWSDRSFSMQLTRTERLDQDRIDETLPSLQFTQSRRELIPPADSKRGKSIERKWFNDVYYQYSSKLLNSREKSGDKREDRAGWDHDLSANFSRKFRGWLGYSTRFGWSETWYDRDKVGQRYVRRGMWNASSSVNTNIYGTFFPRVGPLVGVRHIITPSVSFTYQPKNEDHFYRDENGNEQDRFYSVGGFGGSRRRSRRVSFSLGNKLQTKYMWKGEEKRNDQLLALSNSISYDLEQRDPGEYPWSPLSSSLRFEPVRPFSSELSLTHDVRSRRFTSLSFQSSVRFSGSLGESKKGGSGGEGEGEEQDPTETLSSPTERSPFEEDRSVTAETGFGDELGGGGRRQGPRDSSVIPWNASFSHRFSRGTTRDNFTQWLNSSLGINLTKGWDLDYENRYDLEERKTVSQGLRLKRDLHCWEASFRARFSGDEWEYYFNIRIKAHPEIYYEKGERRLGL